MIPLNFLVKLHLSVTASLRNNYHTFVVQSNWRPCKLPVHGNWNCSVYFT